MTVNTGVKGTLAKLLATEDLVIEHKNCETASFDVDKRVLTLPNWEKATEEVYDLLVAHEVGHALFTPKTVWDNVQCPRSYINVTEDARVEKLMKRKYGGLPKTFFRGYRDLNADDFFCINGEPERLNLIDRINLHFKVGNFTEIPIDEKHEYLVNMVGTAETFEDACAAAVEIHRVMLAEQEEKKKQQKVADLENQSEGQPSETTTAPGNVPGEKNEEGQSEPGEEWEDEGLEYDDHTIGGMGGTDSMDAMTDQAFEDAMKQMVEQVQYENSYVSLPKIQLEQVCLNAGEILEQNREHYSQDLMGLDVAESAYIKFKRDSQKEVNLLVKEFECKKAASSYARATSARTGILDTTKLHTYKYNDDLFKKVTVLPQGKNHGMIFLLDWSGSMSNCIIDTVNQVLQLCWFCQKVGIPFDVYAFTNDGFQAAARMQKNGVTDSYEHRAESIVKPVNGEFAIHNDFALMHLCSSKQKKQDLEESFRYLFYNAGAVGYRGYYHVFSFSVTPGHNLSGTPLNEALICMPTLLKEMKKRVQKVTLCVLTDGEAAGAQYYTDRYTYNGRMYANSIGRNCQIRDRKIGKMYPKMNYPTDTTKCLLENIKDNYPDVKVLGFRLIAPREVFSYFNYISEWDTDVRESLRATYKKNKFVNTEALGYDQLYVIPNNSIREDSSTLDNYESGEASRSQLTAAFKKMFKSKKANKRLISTFIQTVA